MYRLSPRLILLILVILIGCDQTIVPPDIEPPDRPVVTAVLDPSDATQHLLLNYPRAANPSSAFPYIQGASVRVSGVMYTNVPQDSLMYWPGTSPPPHPSIDSVISTPQSLEEGNYYTTQLDVRPGDQYELTIEHEDHQITGKVTVPDTFSLEAAGPFRLSWTESAAAALYKVALVRLQDSVTVHITNNVTAETSLTLRAAFEPPHGREGRHPESHGPEKYLVILEAFEEHMAAFQQQTDQVSEDPDRLQAGLDGGYGMFGAVTTMRDTVELGE